MDNTWYQNRPDNTCENPEISRVGMNWNCCVIPKIDAKIWWFFITDFFIWVILQSERDGYLDMMLFKLKKIKVFSPVISNCQIYRNANYEVDYLLFKLYSTFWIWTLALNVKIIIEKVHLKMDRKPCVLLAIQANRIWTTIE